MSFDDLPRIRSRKWLKSDIRFSSLEKAKRNAKFVEKMDGVKAVKITKEVRWRMWWQQEKQP